MNDPAFDNGEDKKGAKGEKEKAESECRKARRGSSMFITSVAHPWLPQPIIHLSHGYNQVFGGPAFQAQRKQATMITLLTRH
jgi:hypothetical protein